MSCGGGGRRQADAQVSQLTTTHRASHCVLCAERAISGKNRFKKKTTVKAL